MISRGTALCGIFSLPVRVGLPVHLALLLRPAADTKPVTEAHAARQGGSEWSKRPPTGGPEALRACRPAEQHAVTTSDGTEIRLTHYAIGSKGPIVLAPGYGNAARAFAVDTVPKNYVQYLGEHGYDVWLLDYRASPDLEASRTQFTVDDIAMRDWPAAIDAVRQHTGADSVQAMGHCVGGLSLFMAIGGGLRGPALGDLLLAGRPPDRHARQPRARRRAPGDDVQARSGSRA